MAFKNQQQLCLRELSFFLYWLIFIFCLPLFDEGVLLFYFPYLMIKIFLTTV